MRGFKPPTSAALAAVAAVLAVPGVASANGGDLHFGAVSTGIPVVAVYGVGGLVGAVVLFFLANWVRYRRSQSSGGPSPGPGESQKPDEEHDLDVMKERLERLEKQNRNLKRWGAVSTATIVLGVVGIAAVLMVPDFRHRVISPAHHEEEEMLLVWAEAEPETGPAPLTVRFTADIEGGKAPRKVMWNFGDGTPTSSEENPVHIYEKPGKYRAHLEVSDATGDLDEDYVDTDDDYVDIVVREGGS